MSVICLDFETYYSSDYSLTKLSTEEYVRDPRFEIIGCGISMGGRPAVWFEQPRVMGALSQIDWPNTSVLAYNTMFDGAILSWRCGANPRLFLDALGMARARGKTYRGGSLAVVSELLKVGKKGKEVHRFIGKRYEDFTTQELQDYGVYCCNDVDLTCGIYRLLAAGFPQSEYLIQDAVLRMFLEPMLRFDGVVLQEHYDAVVTKKQEDLKATADALNIEWQGGETYEQVKKTLSSSNKLAALLESLGIEPPKKLSNKGKLIYAFAKTDQEFVDLGESEDLLVASVVSARLGARSTIEETRAERYIQICKRGPWPVPYLYYGAHTGRLSGSDKVNPQNLKRGGKLRQSILPPQGHVLVAADLSQIECRVLNYWAGQTDIVEAFRRRDADKSNPDVYCLLASKAYGRTITPEDTKERIVGKIGELSLGFGAGHLSYQRMLFAQAGLRVDAVQCQNVVDVYRNSHQKVKALWYKGSEVLDALLLGHKFKFGLDGMVDGSRPDEGIGLPNGMFITYPMMHKVMLDDGSTETMYMSKKKFVKVYGAKCVENVCQALARIIMTDAWLRIKQRYRVVLSSHDELVAICTIADAEECAAFMKQEMTRPVPWAPGLPIACETGWGYNYGECKK